MGIDPHLVASTLSLVIAQRLVRTLCDTCDGEGCDTCKQSGFFGRSVIVEVYEPDDEMKVLITNKRPLSEYIGHARSHGFETMHDDGMEKVLWGVTTKSEVIDALYR
jgi:general secretion pathway protein E